MSEATLRRPQVPIRVSECFLSIQGEGPSAGTPAHFIRLQGCDVGCHWCDSKYTWGIAGGHASTVEDALDEVSALGPAPMLVVTGGEPLDHDGIYQLLDRAIARWPRVEVETSGVRPPRMSHERLYWNVSPKLPTVTPRWAETWAHANAWAQAPRATFKLVIGSETDRDDALRLLAEHRVPARRVMLMPEGLTDDTVREHAALVVETCRQHGLRLSPRLHIWLWGAKRGL
jgi:organic radical activating enzyme